MTNAYLLCRLADTIEDDVGLDQSQKSTFHARFVAVVKGDEGAEAFAAALLPLLSGPRSAGGARPRAQRGVRDPRDAQLLRRRASGAHALRRHHVQGHAGIPARQEPARPRESQRARVVLLLRRGRRRRDVHGALLPALPGNREAARRDDAARGVVRSGSADDQHIEGHLGRPAGERMLVAALGVRGRRLRARAPRGAAHDGDVQGRARRAARSRSRALAQRARVHLHDPEARGRHPALLPLGHRPRGAHAAQDSPQPRRFAPARK